MNTQVFNQAKTAYQAGEYTEALQLLTACLEDADIPPQPGEVGLLYHQIGNCLVKLGNHNEAIQAYTQATADGSYGACGSVNYNLGMAYAALGDYEDAIRVGEKSLNANLRLTNLRMYALSEQGLLADRLFDYPQYYGSEGLLCVSDTGRHLYRFDARDICQYLGVPCDSNIHTTTDYFNSVVFRQQLVADSLMGIELARSNNPDSLQGQIDMHYEKLKTDKRRIDDYILCGLLLDRNIDGFKEKLDELYSKEYFSDSVVPVDSLPRAYREAMVMIYPEIGDTMMLEQYATYLDLKESEKDSTVSSNITRRKKIGENSPRTFGNTYWWYYYNPKITRKRSK